MRDPIRELEDLDLQGMTVNPLPASEVRRRGDRLRRRNNLVAAAGSLAVVAAIVAPLAALAGHDTSSKEPVDPATHAPKVQWRQTIPADFDIAALPRGASFQFTVNKNGSVVDDITMCGAPAFSTASDDPAGPAVDTAGAAWGEGNSEGSEGRTLAVYRDDDHAAAALQALRTAVENCPHEPKSGNGGPFVNDVVDLPVPSAEESLVFTRQVQFDKSLLSDLTAFEVARVGNALYLGTAYTTAGGDQASGVPVQLVDNSAPVLDQMCVFSADGCDSSGVTTQSEAPESGLSGTIPDEFPLLAGLPTEASIKGKEFGRQGPSRDLDPRRYGEISACGVTPSGLPKAVDTLYAGFADIDAGHLRQLMTFRSAAEAQEYADLVFRVFLDCPKDTRAAPLAKIYEVSKEPGYGDYAATSVMRLEARGKPDRGTQVVEIVRVGQAVLLTLVNDEGTTVASDVESVELSAHYLEASQRVIDAMGG